MDYILYLLFFLLSWTAVHHFLSLLSRSQRNLPPGPTPLPIIGNLLSLSDKPHIALSHLAQTYGPVLYLQLGSLKTVVISSPELAKEVMQKHDISFSHRTTPDATRACNINEFSMVFVPPHAAWRNLRKIANSQIFSTKQLDASSDLRKAKVKDLLSHVDACSRAGVAVDIGQAAFDTTLNLLSNTLFSMDLMANQSIGSASSGNSRVGGSFKELVRQITVEIGKPNRSDFFPLLKWLDPQRIRRRTEVPLCKMLDFLDGIVDKRLEAIAAATAAAAVKDRVNDDALDALLEILNPQDSVETFNRNYLRHLLLALFVAGTDTNSNTLEWVITELLRNPIKMKKAQQEIQDLIGKENSIDEEHISKLSYLQAVIKETLRLHPPAPFLVPRKATTNVELSGFTVPKGSQVLVNVWAVGRDPTVWKDPNSFEPERFIGLKIDVKGLDFQLTPFGTGRRICPGLPLVTRMLPMMIGSLIHSFDWRLEEKTLIEGINMEENFGITLQKAQPLMAFPVQKT